MEMIIDSVENIRWSNAEHTAAECEILIQGHAVRIPFTADQNDVENHGIELFNKIRDGYYGSVEEYVMPESARLDIEYVLNETTEGAQTL